MPSIATCARTSAKQFTTCVASSRWRPLLLTALLCTTMLAAPAFALKCGESEPASTHPDLEAEATGQRRSTAADAFTDAEAACQAALVAKAAALAGPVTCDSSDCWFWEGCNGTRRFTVSKISYDRDWARYEYGRSPIQPCDTTSVLSGLLGCADRTVRITIKCKGTVEVQKSCGGCALCPPKGGDIRPGSSTLASIAGSDGSRAQPTEIGLLCDAYGNDEAKIADAIIATME